MRVELVISLYMVSLENPENQNLNPHFNVYLLRQCYHKVYESMLISEIKRAYIINPILHEGG